MTDPTDLQDLLLEWEEQNQGIEGVRAFCESRGVGDEPTVQEFAKRAQALQRINGFLADEEPSQCDSVSTLKPGTIETQTALNLRSVLRLGDAVQSTQDSKPGSIEP